MEAPGSLEPLALRDGYSGTAKAVLLQRAALLDDQRKPLKPLHLQIATCRQRTVLLSVQPEPIKAMRLPTGEFLQYTVMLGSRREPVRATRLYAGACLHCINLRGG